MINVEFYVDEKTQEEFSVTVNGHSTIGTKGNDILCASISTLVFSVLSHLDQYTSITYYIEENEIRIFKTSETNEQIFRTMMIFLYDSVAMVRHSKPEYTEQISLTRITR